MMLTIVGEVGSEESALIGMMDSATREIKVFTKNFPDGELKEEYQYRFTEMKTDYH